MNNLYRMLPPLNSLIGFEAAARLGSFSLAADELNITQSAISHHIRALETHLQQPLFLRINRQVELTDAGRDLEQTAEAALETVRYGVRRLEAYSKPGSVVLHMSPSLGTLWFLPRLSDFRAKHPQIDPWLFTADTDIELAEAEVDITITQNPEPGEGVIQRLIFQDQRIPLASLELAKLYCSDMENAPLLHDESPEDWQKWFLAAGQTREDYANGPNFSDSAMMLEAAVQGLGVCLGSVVLAKPIMDAGKLVPLSDISVPVNQPFYIVTLERNLKREGVRILWEWLLEQSNQDCSAASSG